MSSVTGGTVAIFDHRDIRHRLCRVLTWLSEYRPGNEHPDGSTFGQFAFDLERNGSFMSIDETVLIVLVWLMKRPIKVLAARSIQGDHFCATSAYGPELGSSIGLPVDGAWLNVRVEGADYSAQTLHLANWQASPAHYDLIELA